MLKSPTKTKNWWPVMTFSLWLPKGIKQQRLSNPLQNLGLNQGGLCNLQDFISNQAIVGE
jgi:hypothetical protein